MHPTFTRYFLLGAGFWLAGATAGFAGQATIFLTNGSSNSRNFVSHTCSSASGGFMKDPIAAADTDAGACWHTWPIPQDVYGTARYEDCTINYNLISDFYSVSGDCTLDNLNYGAGYANLFVTLTN